MGSASKEKLDKAHEMGVRDGKAGGPPKRPETAMFFTSSVQNEINDAYERGYEAGKKQRDKR
jgi:hypothetical protein